MHQVNHLCCCCSQKSPLDQHYIAQRTLTFICRGTVPGAYWEAFIPDLKIRCVSAHLLQQSLADLLNLVLPFASESNASALLRSLSDSRAVAAGAMKDEDVSTAFQEALFTEWGDGVAAVEEALESAARLSHLHGSGMFFLTQEASATNAIVRILSVLYAGTEHPINRDWDSAAFAEAQLLEIIAEVHGKFLESERKESHLIDPHVWRHTGDSGVKIALYCTCFAPVVVEILKVIRSLSREQFLKNKQAFFSIAYSLIPVQSEEIRQMVSEVLKRQVAPLIGVEIEANQKRPAKQLR